MAGQFATGTPPGTTITRPIAEKTSFNRWVIAIVTLVIVVVGVLFALIYQSSAIVTTKNFSYSTAADQSSNYTLEVTNINGAVTLAPWGQASFLINGTVTAKGLGSSPAQVNLVNSSMNGNIIFQAQFPNNAVFLISQTYSVKINLFIPLSAHISKLVVDNVNGRIQATGLNVTGASISSSNGDIDFNCSICASGGFSAQTTNGNIARIEGAVSVGGGWTIEPDDGRSARGCQMKRARVASNEQSGSTRQSYILLERRRNCSDCIRTSLLNNSLSQGFFTRAEGY